MKYNTGIQFVDEFLNNENYEVLGKGTNGIALKMKMGQKNVVIKFTNSSSEFKLTRKLMSLQKLNKIYLQYSSEVISLHRLSKFKYKFKGNTSSYKYLIITEYLICSDKLKNYFEKHVFGSIMNYCFANKMFLSELIKLPKPNLKLIISSLKIDSTNEKDLYQMIDILKLHHKIGSGDFHSGNLGYSEIDGNIKAFDFDELQINSKFKI